MRYLFKKTKYELSLFNTSGNWLKYKYTSYVAR